MCAPVRPVDRTVAALAVGGDLRELEAVGWSVEDEPEYVRASRAVGDDLNLSITRYAADEEHGTVRSLVSVWRDTEPEETVNLGLAPGYAHLQLGVGFYYAAEDEDALLNLAAWAGERAVAVEMETAARRHVEQLDEVGEANLFRREMRLDGTPDFAAHWPAEARALEAARRGMEQRRVISRALGEVEEVDERAYWDASAERLTVVGGPPSHSIVVTHDGYGITAAAWERGFDGTPARSYLTLPGEGRSVYPLLERFIMEAGVR